MAENEIESTSPTVKKVLEEFIKELLKSEDFDSQSANRLDILLKSGKVPKCEEIDAALFPKVVGENT